MVTLDSCPVFWSVFWSLSRFLVARMTRPRAFLKKHPEYYGK